VINVGVVGYGYWGPNLARNFNTARLSRLAAVGDLNVQKLQLAKLAFPEIKTYSDMRELINDPAIDVIAISTPVSTHYPLALAALESGKHVWLEKPMCETSDQAKRLIDIAHGKNLVLHVDHTYVYGGAVRKIRDLVTDGTLGNILYYDSTRINLGLFQHDVNVIWDLAVHDFAILDFILNKHPVAISAHGVSHIPDSPENLANISMFYEAGMVAHINVNWLAPVKIRSVLLGGDKKMIVYDDLHPTEKIKIYDRGVTISDNPDYIHKMRIGYRIGDMSSPDIDTTEALYTETAHFLDCVQNGGGTMTPGEAGLRVVRWLEAATHSMKHQGMQVRLAS